MRFRDQPNGREQISRRSGRTPYRLQLKFTEQEWNDLGDISHNFGRSRYDYIKRVALHASQFIPKEFFPPDVHNSPEFVK